MFVKWDVWRTAGGNSGYLSIFIISWRFAYSQRCKLAPAFVNIALKHRILFKLSTLTRPALNVDWTLCQNFPNAESTLKEMEIFSVNFRVDSLYAESHSNTHYILYFHVDWACAEIISRQHESSILDDSVYASKHILQKTLSKKMPRAQYPDTYKSGQKTTLSSIFYPFYQKQYDQSTLKCQKPLISRQKRKKFNCRILPLGLYRWYKGQKIFFCSLCRFVWSKLITTSKTA
jgi:hypothetical protein